MTFTEIFAALTATGISFRYEKWATKPTGTYGVYTLTPSENFFADGEVYTAVETLTVRIYSKSRDFSAEQKIESVLQNYQKDSEYDNDEKKYVVTYQKEVIYNA